MSARAGMRSELDAFLRLHAGGEMVLHQRHLGDEVGGFDQLRLGVPPGDDDMQIGPARLQGRDHAIERSR